MNEHCKESRRALWRALEGYPDPARLVELSFDVHIVTCAECRDLLEREQALEMLLSHLPDTRLPADVVGRLIARLRESLRESQASGDPLDRLLESVDEPTVPVGLGASLASAVRRKHADEVLDVVLERVPAPVAPEGLATSLLESLAWARRRPARVGPGVLWSAAAGLLVAITAAFLFFGGADRGKSLSQEELKQEVLSAIAAGDIELLKHLDVLENWDLVVGNELDILLSSVEPLDEFLLDFKFEVPLPDHQEPRTDASHG